MKQNRSLAISAVIQEYQHLNILNLLESVFPEQIFKDTIPGTIRNRVFTSENTLLTMVLTATQEDKSLKNSVGLYYGLHQKLRERLFSEAESDIARYEQETKGRPKVGRPRKKDVNIPKSKQRDISLNTAAYSKARTRLPLELTAELFKASSLVCPQNQYSHWHNRQVFIGDGTYVQMQDTPELHQKYKVMHNGKESDGYPQGLIVAVIERGTGQITAYDLSDRHKSELELFYDLIDQLPGGSVLLLDDLYNCYEIIAKCMRKNIDIIVPAKRKRVHEVVKKISETDQIIEIKAPINRSPWLKDHKEIPSKIKLRQIKCTSPEGKEYKLHSTILDEQITAEEFQIQYLTRWDIEISIREVKTIMDINILRSKTPEMILKELNVALATYNLIRQIIYKSIEGMPFFPKEDFIQKFYTLNKDILIDKKGRVYSRWSTGRRRTNETNKKGDATKAKTWKEIY
jgi:ribosomal protein L31E